MSYRTWEADADADFLAGMDLRHVFGRNVRRLRLQAGMAQEELAAILEVDQAYVSRLEAGQKNATLSTIALAAKALGVEPAALLDASETNRAATENVLGKTRRRKKER